MKNYARYLFTCIPAAVMAWGCTSDSYTIQGTIRGLANGDSVLIFMNHGLDTAGNPLPPDSLIAVVDNGIFKLNGHTDRTVYAYLRLKGHQQSPSFFIERGQIALVGDIDSLDNVSITGTPNNDVLDTRQKKEQAIFAKITPLLQQLRDTTAKTETQAMEELNQQVAHLRDSLQTDRVQFVANHPDSYASAIYLRLLTDRIPLDTLEHLFGQFSDEIKASLYGKQIAAKITAKKRTAIGKLAPDFEAMDTAGNPVKLSDYRGQHVLVDFWASWCIPCRQEHPSLKAAYTKYGTRGFTIIGVSLDEKRDRWLEAIAEDGLSWTNVSTLHGFGDPIARLYGVQPIPDNFLIDPDGRIIARALRGEQVLTLLDTLITKH